VFRLQVLDKLEGLAGTFSRRELEDGYGRHPDLLGRSG